MLIKLFPIETMMLCACLDHRRKIVFAFPGNPKHRAWLDLLFAPDPACRDKQRDRNAGGGLALAGRRDQRRDALHEQQILDQHLAGLSLHQL
jgi:hypothetical protein